MSFAFIEKKEKSQTRKDIKVCFIYQERTVETLEPHGAVLPAVVEYPKFPTDMQLDNIPCS